MDSRVGRVLAENPLEIGGDYAISTVPDNYRGPCAVKESGNGRVIAVLPTKSEAYRVAKYGIRPDGGYGSTIVEPSDLPVSHFNFTAWLDGSV